jgi:hypothetical protein
MTNNNNLERVLKGLMNRYVSRVPDVPAIFTAMRDEGIISSDEEIENDHIAFRTLAVSHLGIQSLEKIFLGYGYERRDRYFFESKKLNAFWYSPPLPKYPRIFISELRVDDLSDDAAAIVRKYTDTISSDPVDALDLSRPESVDEFLHSGLWPLPTVEDYDALASETEYGAWAIYNRYYLNHFTISVHNLKSGYNTISDFNRFLERRGFVLNDSGGKIKQSPDGGLLQSATVANLVEAEFAGGVLRMIPGSYVEFAERRVLPQFANLADTEIRRGHRREGFEAANADRIFESTYSEQVEKR